MFNSARERALAAKRNLGSRIVWCRILTLPPKNKLGFGRMLIMSASTPGDRKWRFALLPALAIAFVSLIPQIHFWIVRGTDWNGAYAIFQGDETYYSAYINALIDGRPRRNDPFTGQDDHPQAPMFESLFSIQCLPAYAIAFSARMLRLSASTGFIVLAAVIGFLASLSVFWLLVSVTNDSRFAVVGVFVVLCLGALAGGQGWVGLILKSDALFAGQLYLRRYLPAAPFPLFFVFCSFIYQSLTIANKRLAAKKALLAGLIFCALIFSYFYLWTAAIAWFVCIGFLWLAVRRNDRRRTARLLVISAIPIVLALGAYAYLLSNLPPEVNSAQVLTYTHRPDLLRTPEIIAALVLLMLAIAIRQGRCSLHDPRSLIGASFALLPFIVFNQQVITGRSMQPYHYEVFIGNYVVLIGLLIVIKLFRPHFSRRALMTTAALCLAWGVIEVNQQFKLRSTFDVRNDEMVPVFVRLKQLASLDGTWDGLRSNGRAPALVFSPQYGVSRLLPTWAPQASLLAPGSAPFQSLAQSQRKEWLYTHMYYSGITNESFRELLQGRTEDGPFAYFVKSTVFGNERVHLFLGNSQPVRQEEIDDDVAVYEAFVTSFSREQAGRRRLTYVVIPTNISFDFSRLDRWYERDSGEQLGSYTLYRVRLRE